MKFLRPYLVIFVGCILLTVVLSCRKLRVEDAPRANDFIQAAAYIGHLKEKGELPGINPEEHIRIRSVPVPYSTTNNVDVSKLDIRATVDGKRNIVFWYGIVKTAESGNWKLASAWKTDGKGNNIALP